jgi:hypothetical protein
VTRTVVVVVSDRGKLYLPGCFESLEAHDNKHKLGMAGAVRAGWEQALELGADFVFHLEEDFRFLCTPPVLTMEALLRRLPDLAQVVL